MNEMVVEVKMESCKIRMKCGEEGGGGREKVRGGHKKGVNVSG